MVVEKPNRNKGIGGKFLKLLEYWLAGQDIEHLQMDSSPAAENFYRKNGYDAMELNDPQEYERHPQDISLGKALEKKGLNPK